MEELQAKGAAAKEAAREVAEGSCPGRRFRCLRCPRRRHGSRRQSV